MKAELSKLGNPSRAYAEKIVPETMDIDSTQPERNRISIDQRFHHIESVRPN